MAKATLTRTDGAVFQLETHDELDHALAPFPCCDRYADGRLYPKTRVTAVPTSHDFDTHYCGAIALCCGKKLGRIEVKMETIFGIDEDRRVLEFGRVRVY